MSGVQVRRKSCARLAAALPHACSHTHLSRQDLAAGRSPTCRRRTRSLSTWLPSTSASLSGPSRSSAPRTRGRSCGRTTRRRRCGVATRAMLAAYLARCDDVACRRRSSNLRSWVRRRRAAASGRAIPRTSGKAPPSALRGRREAPSTTLRCTTRVRWRTPPVASATAVGGTSLAATRHRPSSRTRTRTARARRALSRV